MSVDMGFFGKGKSMDLRIEDVKYTVSDIMALPQGERAELIDGYIYMMAPPNRIHQDIVAKLVKDIGNYIDKKGGNCRVYPAPFGVFLNNDDENYVEPDISVICDRGKLQVDGCHGAPDWIIEVLSQGSRHIDLFVKLNKYRTAGVREYWIIDPMTETARVYDFMKDKEYNYAFKDDIKVRIYEDLELSFADLMDE